MTTRLPARAALPILLAVAAAAAGCGLPEKVRALVAPKPTPTAVPAPTPLPVPPLKMDFVKIREERARGGAGMALCAVDIELGGAKRSEIAAARVLVRAAVDDLGTSLVPDDAAAARLAPLDGGDNEAPVVLAVPLKVASRKATSIHEVSGEIELYVPGADPSAPTVTEGLDARRLPPNTLRRYRFSLKDVPLP
jgi:hypothetical protein